MQGQCYVFLRVSDGSLLVVVVIIIQYKAAAAGILTSDEDRFAIVCYYRMIK